ncbi:allantoin transporter [Microbacterium bovistercoris]|uniref:Allantoin transporter n=1 Tax=Microbacterium bovistercoris TaxID=2293570 RepID=A0A371NX92_9MICO|nr:cytosine permease [Microbacterium bovistercoris]REJ06665.1 allantoin transporter [Microbacterium bovistercoris]
MSTPAIDPVLVDPGAEKVAEYAARGYAEEVLPIRPKDRTWKTPQFITVWMGPIHNILSYFTVMTFFALGLNAWQVVAAIMTSAVIVSIGYILNGQAAAKYGIPFAMQLREAFGHKGALIPTWVRGIIAGFMFFGITSVSSAQAFDVVFETIWPGYMNLGNGAEILGLPIPTAISYLITWIITVGLFLGGQAFLGRFSNWANPVVFILVVIAVVLAVINAGGMDVVMSTRVVDSPVTPLVFISCVAILVSNWAGPIVNTGDYTRNATSMKAPAVGFPIGVIGSYILFAVVTVSFIGALQVVSGGEFDINQPFVFIQAINEGVGNPFVVVLLILAMNVGAVAFVVFGNMLPAGLQLTAQLPKIFTIKRGAILAAVIGTLILPWQFVENTDALFLFYSLIGSMFGPIVGIMLASYFVERKRTLDVEGIYADYKGGQEGSLPAYNRRALGVLIASFVITMIGRVPGIANVEFLAQVNNLAFFSGLIIGFIGYTLLTLAARKSN